MSKFKKIATLAFLPRSWKAALFTRTAAATEHKSVIANLRPQTLIDVGANKGQFSLLVRSVLPKAKILAFEPLASEADLFSKNFEKDSDCKLFRFALSEQSGTAEFHVADRADSSSLLSIGERQRAAYGVTEARMIQVDVRRLDEIVSEDMLAGSVLLKIDVQGAEDMVLRGATNILPFIDFVYLEASFIELYEGQKLAGDMVALMGELGYGLRGVGASSETKRFGATQADLLFSRKGMSV